MIRVTNRNELGKTLNFGKYPVLTIDLADSDEHGMVGSKCRIDMGTFQDGSKFYERAQVRAFKDEKKLTFKAGGCVLSADFGYSDLMSDVEYATAPIIEPESEFVIVIHDSRYNKAYACYIIHTLMTRRFCSTPIEIEPVDLSAYFAD